MSKKIVSGLLLLAGLALLAGCVGQTEDPRVTPTATNTDLPTSTPMVKTAKSPAPIAGYPAPDFTLPNLEGKELSLSDFKGQVVLVNFWATWWPYCRQERSALQKAHEQYHNHGFVILSVDIGEDRETVQAFVQEKGLTFPVLLDEKQAVAQTYRIPGVPTSFFVNREGMVQARHVGPMSESLIKEYLDQIL